ncbi:hypothetical protein Bbelb_354540, partial [Branchiostoma belcheri]
LSVQETTESPLSLTSEVREHHQTDSPPSVAPPCTDSPSGGERRRRGGVSPKVNGRGHKDLPVREGNGDGRAGPPPAGSTNLRREQKERDAVLERMDETRREHKYFEIPATDFQQTDISPMNPSSKDMSELKKKRFSLCFTVNLDDTSPLKLSVGDSVSKFAPSPRQQRKERTEGVGADETLSSPRGMHRRRRLSVKAVDRWRSCSVGPGDEAQQARVITDDDSVHSDMPVSRSQHLDGTRSESETESRHPHLHGRVRPEEQRGQQEMSPLAQADLHRRKKITPEDMLLDQRSFTEKKVGVRGSVEKVQTRKGTEGASPQQGKAEAERRTQGHVRPAGRRDRVRRTPRLTLWTLTRMCVRRTSKYKTSDAGTYTIELDEPNPEVEEARRKIDEVFGVTEAGEPQKAAKDVESPTEPGIQGPGVENQSIKDCQRHHAANRGLLPPSPISFIRLCNPPCADHPASAEAESGGFGQVEVIFTGSWKRASQQPKQRPVGPIPPSAPSWVHQCTWNGPSEAGYAKKKALGCFIPGVPKTGRKRRTLPAIPKDKPSSQPSSRNPTTPPVEKSTRVSAQGEGIRTAGGGEKNTEGSFTLDEDTPSILKELQPSADDTMKVLDAASDGRESSGDSDMDTVSTTSVADGDVGVMKSKSASRRSLSSQHWERSHDGDKLRDTSAKQRLRESRRSDPYGDRSSTISDVLSSSDADTQVGRSGITEKGGGTAFHIEGTPTRRSLGRGEKKSRPTDLQKSASMEVNKSGTFPKPRPTRASLLRRNRLESDSARSGPDSSGELEDYPETPSEASTASTSSTSSRPRPSSAKSSREMEMQARLDRLSKPRAGRLKDPPKSDRSDLSLGGQIVKAARTGSGQPKQGSVRASPQAKTRTASGHGHSRSKSISSTEKGSGSGVWRRKSEAAEASGGSVWRRRKDNWEDHGSRSSTESAGDTTDRSESRVKRSSGLSFGDSARALRRESSANRSRKGYATTPEPGRSTTDEISRLSQQLAADLAILAQGTESDDGAKHVPKREWTAKRRTVLFPGTAEFLLIVLDTSEYATLPRAAKASKAAKHLTGVRKPKKEQLVERIFEDSMSKQSKSGGGPRGVYVFFLQPLDNLVITSVHRLSQKIKLTIDRTVAKAKDDGDLPMLKSSNQEIATILGNLRRVERQIEVLDRLIDPDDQIPVDSTEDDSSSTLVGPPASTPSSTGHRTPVSEYEQKTRSWQAADRSLSEQFNPSGDEDYSTME